MARIYPFRALRYDTSRVRMEDVVTQPYDKITPEMQQRYYEASPYNLVRIILGKHEPDDTEAEEFLAAGEEAHNVYTRAAEWLREWRREGVLAEEAEPALYGYSQSYTVPQTSEVRERRGFIALGHLYEYADKVVYRHEQTFPKYKSRSAGAVQGDARLLRAGVYAVLRPGVYGGEADLRDREGRESGPSRRPCHHG